MTLTPAHRINQALNRAWEALSAIDPADVSAAGHGPEMDAEITALAARLDALCLATATN